MEPDVYAAFRVINEKLNIIIKLMAKESLMLDELIAQVERNRTVDESAKVLIQGLVEKINELAALPTVDPAQIQALADELKASTDDLAAAISSNTPAEEE